MIQDECGCLLGNNHAEQSEAKKFVPQESEHVCVDEWFPQSTCPLILPCLWTSGRVLRKSTVPLYDYINLYAKQN